MQCLLISSSRAPGFGYLQSSLPFIRELLGARSQTIAFIPYARVHTVHAELSAFDSYHKTVSHALSDTRYIVESVHQTNNPMALLNRCNAILVGGGNTFNLLRLIGEHGLACAIRRRVVQDRIPFIGWSAGANIACPTIRTTNDMPIVEPYSLDALGLVPFQINPHYINEQLENQFSETRDIRLSEFVELNRQLPVLGLPEGMLLKINETTMHYTGISNQPARLFQHGSSPCDIPVDSDLSKLLNPDTK